MHTCVKIVTFRNKLIQIHANLLKNCFPPNIIHAKYNTFTVLGQYSELWLEQACLQLKSPFILTDIAQKEDQSYSKTPCGLH